MVLGVAASIPVVAAFDVPVYVAGILGAVVVFVEGLLQAYQYRQNWITYRSTAESLKHEKYLYLARADVYAGSRDPLRLLAERIEGLISQEHARWISSSRRQPDKKAQGRKRGSRSLSPPTDPTGPLLGPGYSVGVPAGSSR